ncbi:LOW QUALITY PROTEIN: RING finger protein 32 [Chlamydotis macqueenii]
MERHDFYKGRSSKQGMIAVSAVALQDHIISHQLPDLSLADPFKSRTRNTKNIKPVNKEMVRAVVDTGLRKKNKNKEDPEKEYVLDPSLPQLTLAQKSGLIEPPSLPLTAEEWVKIKQRSRQHGDSTQPCATCREEFALQHQACLKAFEKFTGKKSCPMCRKEQYQTQVTHDGACLFKIQCSVRILSSWRGYIARKWYKNLRKTMPSKDSKLRKQLFAKSDYQPSLREREKPSSTPGYQTAGLAELNKATRESHLNGARVGNQENTLTQVTS